MCESHEYKLLISDKLKGENLEFLDFPQLNVIYVKGQNNLCPSNYSSAVCVWEGDLQLTLRVNGKEIILNDHDHRKQNKNIVGKYELQGIRAVVDNRSREETYLIFSIKKCTTNKTYNINQPFIIEFGDNPTTGYSWKVKVSPGLEIVGDTYFTQCKKNLPGCGGMRTYILKGIKLGEQTLIATHGQSWNPETIKTYTYKFNIV